MARSEGPDWLGGGETISFQTKESWLAWGAKLVQSILAAVVLGLVAWAGSQASSSVGRVVTLIVIVAGALVLLRLLWSILMWSRSRLVLTNEKVVHVYGVFGRQIDAMPLVKVNDVTVQQSFVGRMFHYGQLLVDDGSGNRAPLHGLRWIPRPVDVYRQLTDSARRERAYEGGAFAGQPQA